jgi:hypothetical protein
MLPDVNSAIHLQELDNRIRDLQQEVSALPKHIAAIERTLESHERKLDADHAALAANQRERKTREGEIQVQEQKISKLKDQMMSAKTNEQYRAFQHEIEYCQKEIRKAEDRILDLMAESEPLDQNVKVAEGALKEEKQRVDAEKKVTRERTAVDERELAQLRSQREAIVGAMSAAVYSAYQRIRAKRHGLAIAEASDGRCGACNIALRPQFFQELRAGDVVMYCESCGRILFYNPPVLVEPELADLPNRTS